jgi:hypothetical protein
MKMPDSRPKAAVYLACIMLVAHSRITAQAPGVPEQALDIHPIGPDMVLEWQSVVGRTYFLQLSGGLAPTGTGPALQTWAWANVIEEGDGDPISYEFGGDAPHGFARLNYTDEPRPPGVSLDDWDTDGDGISNIDEINPPGGFAQTNPLNPDTDGDGLGDGWERSFATRMLALGAPPEHWGDNWPALQSGNFHPQSTLQDGGMNIREIHDATSLHDPEMILHDLFIQAKRAEYVFWVLHDSHEFDDNTPTVNDGAGFVISGSSGYGSGSIETWSRTLPAFFQLEVQSDPFSVTPDTSPVWFANESGAAIWTYHTHWDQAGDPNPGTLFPIENMGQSSVTYQLAQGGDSQYYQFQATGPVIGGQVTTKTRWSGETRKSEFRLYRPHPTADPVSRTFLKVTTERSLEMIGGDPGYIGWSGAPPVTTVETITATIPVFGHTSEWIETSPEPAAQKYRTVDLLPVEVKVVKEGEAAAPEDGLVVKKSDTVRYRLSPGLPDAPLLLEDKIQWHWRILKWDGTYSGWTAYQNGQGHTFIAQPEDAGIYEVKATVEGQDFFLKRAKDDPHSAKKKDENDCFGVVEGQWQIDVRDEAKKNLGSKAYAKAAANPPLGIGKWKCNLFVAHKATDGGAVVPWINGGSYYIGTTYPPVANQWAGTEVKHIPNWTLLPRETYPQPGWVIARGVAGGIGHVGVIGYDGAWISAGGTDVNRNADLREAYYNDEDPATPEGPARFRKYSP